MSLLGKRVRDRYTNFEGIVTGRTEMLGGSTQVLVEGHDAGFRRDEWLEEGRLEEVQGSKTATVLQIVPGAPTP